MTQKELEKIFEKSKSMTREEIENFFYKNFTNSEMRELKNDMANMSIAVVFESLADGTETYSIRSGKLPEKSDWVHVRFFNNSLFRFSGDKLIAVLYVLGNQNVPLKVDESFGAIELEGYSTR